MQNAGKFLSSQTARNTARRRKTGFARPRHKAGARRDGTPVERQRARRAAYDQLPLFLRAFLLFVYRYVIRLGFLDGREGLIFFTLQAFWFRFLIDAKLYERQRGG